MSTQGRRSLLAKRAYTPVTATPQGKARARSLGDKWGAAVNLLCCYVSSCSFLFFFFRGDAADFFLSAFCCLFFLFAPCCVCRLREAVLEGWVLVIAAVCIGRAAVDHLIG